MCHAQACTAEPQPTGVAAFFFYPQEPMNILSFLDIVEERSKISLVSVEVIGYFYLINTIYAGTIRTSWR